MMKQSEQPKITMEFLFKRNNRNRHFQIIKENDWISVGRVFTGLGLYKAISECGRLSLVGRYDKEYRENIKNHDEMLREQIKTQDNILKCVMIGTNKNANKNDYGEKSVTAGWESE